MHANMSDFSGWLVSCVQVNLIPGFTPATEKGGTYSDRGGTVVHKMKCSHSDVCHCDVLVVLLC